MWCSTAQARVQGLNLATKIVRRGGHINLFGCIREEVTINGR